MTPRPLETFQLANLVAEVSHDLRGCHPNDALGVAQWIATNAIRCWPPRTASPSPANGATPSSPPSAKAWIDDAGIR